ncbi:metal-dependent hydrolase [Agromyces sp. H66]|uniref:metal-dependent hydrolase n=1 Tax=Agromyces sp. H66 TaxID=2529859 RepID=UPI0010AA3F81|nr:metal-dependent hydrolase [Agromyces sp. H66]
MPLPSRDTRVIYPSGALAASTSVLHVAAAGDGRIAVITESTSFHPVDAAWPDQPADSGTLRVRGVAHPIRDAVVAATDLESLHLGSDIPVRKGTEGWAFLVAHLVDADADVAEGDAVEIEADAATRHALSAGHTACHLASLALNRVLADRWSKPAREDALGSPDFDGAAIASSRIVANGSVDRYRLNKSLRRAGFDTASLTNDALEDLGRAVADVLDRWVASGASVRIERDGELLTDRRSWVCELPDGTARIPCGGTHLDSLAEFTAVLPSFALLDDAGTPVLEMTTEARLRH